MEKNFAQAFQNWDTVESVFSMVLTLIFTSVFAFCYWWKVRNKKGSEVPSGFLLLTEIILINIGNILESLLGKKYRKLTPYFLYLLIYINFGNFLTMFLGLESPIGFFTVVLAMGLVTFFGIYYFGFRFQGWSFLKSCLNPVELVSRLASLLSISFRLFGNILAGAFVLSLLYTFLMQTSLGQTLKWFNITAVLVAPLHFYFDFFSGPLHSFIFVILTMTYWSLSKPDKTNLRAEI